jgi:hypothetical protein
VYLTFVDLSLALFLAPIEAFNEEITKRKSEIGNFRPIPLETLHRRVGHIHSNTVIVSSKHRLWADIVAMLAPESFYEPCNVAIIKKKIKKRVSFHLPSSFRLYHPQCSPPVHIKV